MTIDRPETHPQETKPARKSKTIVINAAALVVATVVAGLLNLLGWDIRPEVETAMGVLAAAAITNIVLRFKTKVPIKERNKKDITTKRG